jgi:spore germination cell wall hydrolase CwlJ-like protein
MEDGRKFNWVRALVPAVIVGSIGSTILSYAMKPVEDGRKRNRGNGVAHVERFMPVSPIRANDSLESVASIPVSVPMSKKVEKAPISYKTNKKDFSDDTDSVLLARMLYGEARDCSDAEKVAIAYSAINRIHDGKKWNGETLRGVVLASSQYSCFNSNDPNKKKLMDPQNKNYSPNAWENCLRVAEGVLDGKIADPTDGATHYHTTNVNPFWKHKRQMKRKGRINGSKHIFYKED